MSLYSSDCFLSLVQIFFSCSQLYWALALSNSSKGKCFSAHHSPAFDRPISSIFWIGSTFLTCSSQRYWASAFSNSLYGKCFSAHHNLALDSPSSMILLMGSVFLPSEDWCVISAHFLTSSTQLYWISAFLNSVQGRFLSAHHIRASDRPSSLILVMGSICCSSSCCFVISACLLTFCTQRYWDSALVNSL